jgi:hypothetical protein
MPQKFLSIRQEDFEKARTRSPNAPWIKLHRSLFREREFVKLSPASRFLYTGLILLATEHENRIYNDLTWIGQLLCIPHTEIDLKPLYRAGFLQATNLPRVLEREREREREIEREIAGADAPSRARSRRLTDEEFLQSLKDSPAYKHIDLDEQLAKMDVWIKLHPGRQKTRPFIVKWLNRIEKPLTMVGPVSPQIPPQPPANDPIARGLWNRTYGPLVAKIGGKL